MDMCYLDNYELCCHKSFCWESSLAVVLLPTHVILLVMVKPFIKTLGCCILGKWLYFWWFCTPTGTCVISCDPMLISVKIFLSVCCLAEFSWIEETIFPFQILFYILKTMSWMFLLILVIYDIQKGTLQKPSFLHTRMHRT